MLLNMLQVRRFFQIGHESAVGANEPAKPL